MAKVLCVHRQEPNWPEDVGRPRFKIEVEGSIYWAETEGLEPSARDVLAVLRPPAPTPEAKAKAVREQLEAVTGMSIDELRSVLGVK